MVNFADAAVGNVTQAFKDKGMWNDLVMVFSTGKRARPRARALTAASCVSCNKKTVYNEKTV